MTQQDLTLPAEPGQPTAEANAPEEDWETQMMQVLGSEQEAGAIPELPSEPPSLGVEEPVTTAPDLNQFLVNPKHELPPYLRPDQSWQTLDLRDDLNQPLPPNHNVGALFTNMSVWPVLVGDVHLDYATPLVGDSDLARTLFRFMDPAPWTLLPTVHKYAEPGAAQAKQTLHRLPRIIIWQNTPWWLIINLSEQTHEIVELYFINANIVEPSNPGCPW